MCGHSVLTGSRETRTSCLNRAWRLQNYTMLSRGEDGGRLREDLGWIERPVSVGGSAESVAGWNTEGGGV